jgi:hypothetical protein
MCLVWFPNEIAIMFLKIFNWVVLIVGTVSALCEVGTQFECSIQNNFVLKRAVHDSAVDHHLLSAIVCCGHSGPRI